MESTTDDTLRALYYEQYFGPKSGFAQFVRRDHPTITVKYINDWLKKQQTEQIQYAKPRQKIYSSVVAYRLNEDWEMDVFEAGADLPDVVTLPQHNQRYVLVAIDVYSRKIVLLDPMGNGYTMNTVASLLRDAFDKYGKPININCDNEFRGAVKTLCKNEGVNLMYSQPDDANKNPIVERFNRTLRLQLVKAIQRTGNQQWQTFLPMIQNHYNSTKHNTLKEAPDDVADGTRLSRQRPINKVDYGFHVGDKVRYRLYKGKANVFSKETSYRWSATLHTIERISRYSEAELKRTSEDVGFVPRVINIDNPTGEKIYISGVDRYLKPYELQKVGDVQHGPQSIAPPPRQPRETNEMKEMKEQAAEPTPPPRRRPARGAYSEEQKEERKEEQEQDRRKKEYNKWLKNQERLKNLPKGVTADLETGKIKIKKTALKPTGIRFEGSKIKIKKSAIAKK